jgi:hypothetical protein
MTAHGLRIFNAALSVCCGASKRLSTELARSAAHARTGVPVGP